MKYIKPKNIKKQIIKVFKSKSLNFTNINLAISVFIKGLDSEISSLIKKPIAGEINAKEKISKTITVNDPKMLKKKSFFNFLSIKLKKILKLFNTYLNFLQ